MCLPRDPMRLSDSTRCVQRTAPLHFVYNTISQGTIHYMVVCVCSDIIQTQSYFPSFDVFRTWRRVHVSMQEAEFFVSSLTSLWHTYYRVITSSLANGPLVLRHELGHSVINVGEEYDGGFAYFGPNAGYNASSVPWTHWLTEPPSPDGPPKVERSVMPLQDYAWSMLNVSTPWSSIFESSGSYARHLIRFSLSGLPSANDLKVELDGIDLGWTPKKDIGIDRWHYDVYRDGGLRLRIVSWSLRSTY